MISQGGDWAKEQRDKAVSQKNANEQVNCHEVEDESRGTYKKVAVLLSEMMTGSGPWSKERLSMGNLSMNIKH